MAAAAGGRGRGCGRGFLGESSRLCARNFGRVLGSAEPVGKLQAGFVFRAETMAAADAALAGNQG